MPMPKVKAEEGKQSGKMKALSEAKTIELNQKIRTTVYLKKGTIENAKKVLYAEMKNEGIPDHEIKINLSNRIETLLEKEINKLAKQLNIDVVTF